MSKVNIFAFMPADVIPSFPFFCFMEGIMPGPANPASLNTSLRYGKTTALKQRRGPFTGFFVDAMPAVFLNCFSGMSFTKYVVIFPSSVLAVSSLLPSIFSAAGTGRGNSFRSREVLQFPDGIHHPGHQCQRHDQRLYCAIPQSSRYCC